MGIYREINVSSFALLRPGLYRVDLFSKGKPKQIGRVFLYDSRGVCYRNSDDAPILSGDIKVVSSEKLGVGT